MARGGAPGLLRFGDPRYPDSTLFTPAALLSPANHRYSSSMPMNRAPSGGFPSKPEREKKPYA